MGAQGSLAWASTSSSRSPDIKVVRPQLHVVILKATLIIHLRTQKYTMLQHVSCSDFLEASKLAQDQTGLHKLRHTAHGQS